MLETLQPQIQLEPRQPWHVASVLQYSRRGKPENKTDFRSPRSRQQACPSTTETSVVTFKNAVGTIHGTAREGALEITFYTWLSGLYGVGGGKWEVWHADRTA